MQELKRRKSDVKSGDDEVNLFLICLVFQQFLFAGIRIFGVISRIVKTNFNFEEEDKNESVVAGDIPIFSKEFLAYNKSMVQNVRLNFKSN